MVEKWVRQPLAPGAEDEAAAGLDIARLPKIVDPLAILVTSIAKKRGPYTGVGDTRRRKCQRVSSYLPHQKA
jgi:hypothetical protein